MKMYNPNDWSWDDEEFNNLKKIEDSSEVSTEEVRGQFLKVCELFNAPEDEGWRRFMRLQLHLLDEMRDIDEDIHYTSLQKVRMFALKEVERLLTLDIPLYQRVFEQMDEELSQEVYLGRDGIFAYESRRFQYRARKAAKIPSRRMRPKYLVYSRSYIPNSKGSKYEYLKKQGIKDDARFFDTGFAGSIPEDILYTLEVNEKSGQIVMLSAKKESRRCRNISEHLRDNIVDEIEHRPKMVYTSKGFDEEKNPTEEAAHPISRYIYRVVRLALRYWFYTNPRGELLPLESNENELSGSFEPAEELCKDPEFCKESCGICKSCKYYDAQLSDIKNFHEISDDKWSEIIEDNTYFFFAEKDSLFKEELDEKKLHFYAAAIKEAEFKGDHGFCEYHCMICNECVNNTHDGMSGIFNIPKYWNIKQGAWNNIVNENFDFFFGEVIYSKEEMEEKQKEFYILKVVEAAEHVGLCFKTVKDRMDWLIESTKPFNENLLGENLLGDCDGDFKNFSVQSQEKEVN